MTDANHSHTIFCCFGDIKSTEYYLQKYKTHSSLWYIKYIVIIGKLEKSKNFMKFKNFEKSKESK